MKLKPTLTSSPVLTIYDPEKHCTLYTDASQIGIGAILTQDGHPIAYYSRQLTKEEEKYISYERECLAVIKSIEH
jgi:hypothetical protein